MPPALDPLLLFLILQGCLPFPDDLVCVVMRHPAGPQETAAMRGKPVDEVVVVLEGAEALLHQQREISDRQVVGIVAVVQAAGSFAKGAFHEQFQCHVAHVMIDVKALVLSSLFLPLVQHDACRIGHHCHIGLQHIMVEARCEQLAMLKPLGPMKDQQAFPNPLEEEVVQIRGFRVSSAVHSFGIFRLIDVQEAKEWSQPEWVGIGELMSPGHHLVQTPCLLDLKGMPENPVGGGPWEFVHSPGQHLPPQQQGSELEDAQGQDQPQSPQAQAGAREEPGD